VLHALLPPWLCRDCCPSSVFPFVASRVSKKRKFVADGVMFAEVSAWCPACATRARLNRPFSSLQINELMNRELSDAGYAGVEIRNAPMRTEIIIRGEFVPAHPAGFG
jgi:hypothetical protein